MWRSSRSAGSTPKSRTSALESLVRAKVNGALMLRNQSSPRAVRRAVCSARLIESIFGTCSPTLMCIAVTKAKANAIAIACESSEERPKISSISSATAGSPRKPMPIEAIGDPDLAGGERLGDVIELAHHPAGGACPLRPPAAPSAPA